MFAGFGVLVHLVSPPPTPKVIGCAVLSIFPQIYKSQLMEKAPELSSKNPDSPAHINQLVFKKFGMPDAVRRGLLQPELTPIYNYIYIANRNVITIIHNPE